MPHTPYPNLTTLSNNQSAVLQLYLPRELIRTNPYEHGPQSNEYNPGVQSATPKLMQLLSEGLGVANWVYVNDADYGMVLMPSFGKLSVDTNTFSFEV
jgi:hypothetical protein